MSLDCLKKTIIPKRQTHFINTDLSENDSSFYKEIVENDYCANCFACSCCTVFVTSAEEGGYVFGAVCLSVCLFVCLSVCPTDYSETCERILTKFFGGVGHGSRTK